MNFSGTSSNTWSVYIYDITNSAWIQPAGVYNIVQGSGVGIGQGTFQTPSNMTQFYIALLVVNPVAFTPTIAAGFGTTTRVVASYKREGKFADVSISFRCGTVAASAGNISGLPFAIDTTDPTLADGAGVAVLGYATRVLGNAFAATNSGPYMITWLNSTTVYISQSGGTASTGVLNNDNVSGVFGANNDGFMLRFRVPVSGWSTNTQMSADSDTRVCSALATGTPANTTANNPAIFPTVTFDTHGGYSLSTGRYTVPVAGYYEVKIVFTSNLRTLYCILVNIPSTGCATINTANNGTGSSLVQCVAGDLIDVRPDFATGAWNAGNENIAFTRLTGPAVVAATETVAASYYVSTNYAVTANQAINFDTKLYDTHSAVTTGAANTWKFTAPVSGYYLLTGCLQTTAGDGALIINLYKNSSSFKSLNTMAASNIPGYPLSSQIQLNAGDTISINSAETKTITGSSTPYASYVDISRIK